jgi:hypothetical protein
MKFTKITKSVAGAAVVAGVGLGLALAGTGTASASANTFLSELSQQGIILDNPAGVIEDGNNICGALANGYTVEEVIAATKHDNPGLTWYDAGFEVGAAVRHLC